tara:strand:+ start:439 stop:621 length:183 start_codon:yes stop_codon:yes gene_type:complete
MATRYQFYSKITLGDKSLDRGCIKRILDNGTISCIPMNKENTDYQEYLEWAKTNTTEEAD